MLPTLVFAPSGWGLVGSFLASGNFWIFYFCASPAFAFWLVLVGLFLVGYWAFHGLFLLKHFLWRV